MRWKYLNLQRSEDRAIQAAKLAAIDRWWRAFVPKISELDSLFSGGSQWDLPGWMHENLGAIDPNIFWEFGPAVKGKGHRLVITPESNRGLRPLVATLLDRAPKVPGWEFYPYRLPESTEIVAQTVEARTSGDITGVMVQVTRVDENQIGLRFLSPRTTDEGDQQFLDDAFVATETLLGEEWLDCWVGPIEAVPLSAAASENEIWHTPPIPLERLHDGVKQTIEWIRDDLPDRPYQQWAENASWSMIELRPDEQEDYPGRTDIITLITCNQDLAAATFRSAFFSQRFSRLGEIFCYVKIDGAEGLDPAGFEDREGIEEALVAALHAAGLGTVCGGGTGLRYSYVDLALTEVDRSISLIQETLREGKIPRRTWLLFHDAYLCDEWVGMYDDTPPPPTAE